MIVLDASACVEVLLAAPLGRSVQQRIGGHSIHAPELLLVEVTQVVRRLSARGLLGPERAEEAMADLMDLDLELYGHEPLVRRAWQLRDNLTAYDAVYVALAEGLDAPLLTTDENLAGAPGNDAVIELVTVE